MELIKKKIIDGKEVNVLEWEDIENILDKLIEKEEALTEIAKASHNWMECWLKGPMENLNNRFKVMKDLVYKHREYYLEEKVNMPAKSKAQARLMGVVASGKKKVKGLSKEQAKEFTRGQKVSKLPEKKKNK